MRCFNTLEQAFAYARTIRKYAIETPTSKYYRIYQLSENNTPVLIWLPETE